MSLNEPPGGVGRHREPVVAEIDNWQRRLLPLMVRMIVGLTAFFFLATLVQLVYLHRTIQFGPTLQAAEGLALIGRASSDAMPNPLAAAELKRGFLLEVYAIDRRYHQGNVLLMSRVWTRYLGFSTGMILAMVGSIFILGKLREPSTELDVEQASMKLSVKSASPGIILAVLGVALMLTTIITHHEISVVDRPLYTGQGPSSLPEVKLPDELKIPSADSVPERKPE